MVIGGIILLAVGILLALSPKLLENSGRFGMFLSQLKGGIWAPHLGPFLAGLGVGLLLPLIGD